MTRSSPLVLLGRIGFYRRNQMTKRYSEKQLEEIKSKLIAEGKPIEANWTIFRMISCSDTPQDILDEYRLIFFHSAWLMYTSMLDVGNKGSEAIEKFMNTAHKEFEEFIDFRARQHLINKMKEGKSTPPQDL
jgi:hypothetical protein